MRIAQVLLQPAIGGAESLVASLDAPLRHLGHELSTVYLDGPGDGSDPFSRVHRLRAALIGLRPDVVVGHGALPNVYLRMVRKGPNVTVLHSALDDFEETRLRRAELVLRRRTSAVVAVSAKQQAEYCNRFGTSVPVLVIPNGIGAAFSPGPTASATSGLIATLARVAEQKDPGTWVEIAAEVTAQRDDVEFAWWGPDDPHASLPRKIADRTTSERVRYAGPTDRPASVLRDASLVLHTSRSEAHPVALLEAAAVGVPIVCTDEVARTASSVTIAGTFAAGNVISGRAAVLNALDRLGALQATARAGAEQVRVDFGIERCAAAYDKLLTSVVARR